MSPKNSEKTAKTRYRSTFYFEGKRYECVGKNQREADQKAAIKLDKLKRGEVGVSCDMTVERWALEWLETYKKPVVGTGSYKNYLAHINGVILPAIGDKKLKEIKDIHLQKILNNRIGKSRSDLSKLRMTMKAMFKRAYLSKIILYFAFSFFEFETKSYFHCFVLRVVSYGFGEYCACIGRTCAWHSTSSTRVRSTQ